MIQNISCLMIFNGHYINDVTEHERKLNFPLRNEINLYNISMCCIEMWDFNNCLQTIRYKTVYHSTVVGTTLIRLFKMKYYKHIAFN